MITLLTVLALCSSPVVTNKTNVWNDIDEKQLNFSKKRCKQLYPESPCLSRFIKMEENVYRAFCKEENRGRI